MTEFCVYWNLVGHCQLGVDDAANCVIKHRLGESGNCPMKEKEGEK
jgi:hypothetical protein